MGIRTGVLTGVALTALFSAIPALAADNQVKMLNKDSEGRAMQFEPAFIKIAPRRHGHLRAQ
jgi:plastocyanin